MASGTVVLEGAALEQLGDDVRSEYRQAESHATDAVGHAIRCGELLREAKAGLKHGEWARWLAGNFPGDPATASGYMRLAVANRGTSPDLPASINAGLKALARPKPRPSEPPIPTDAGTQRTLADALRVGAEARAGTDADRPTDRRVILEPSDQKVWEGLEDRRALIDAKIAGALGLSPGAAEELLSEASHAARRLAVDLERLAAACHRQT